MAMCGNMEKWPVNIPLSNKLMEVTRFFIKTNLLNNMNIMLLDSGLNDV